MRKHGNAESRNVFGTNLGKTVKTIALLVCCMSGCGPTGQWSANDFFADSEVTALAKAASAGDIDTVDALVKKGVDINARGKDGMTPLLFAMWAKNKEGFRRLLEHGADPNSQIIDGQSVTSFSALSVDDSDWLKMALKYGADPNLVNPHGRVEDEKNRTPLFDVLMGRNLTNLSLLIKAGANLDHQDRGGKTPAMYAVALGWYEGGKILLEAGADVTPKDIYGWDLAVNCFHHTVDPGFTESYQARQWILEFLAQKGVDLEAAKKRASR